MAHRWELSERPLVSVVVATRDRPELLTRALRSIGGQDYRGDIDVHVVFDQSDVHDVPADWNTAAPPGCARKLHVQRNLRSRGLAGARNSGVDAAAGELIAWCDDDDEWLPTKLGRQVEALREDGGACFTAAGVEVSFEGRVRPRLAVDGHVTFGELLRERVMALHPSTFVVHTGALREDIGPVDEDLPGAYGEDYDLVLRAARLAPILTLAGPLARVHWHAASFFSDRWRTIAEANDYLKAKHPEFDADPYAAAWLDGKTAFALAAIGDRRQAGRLALRTLRRRPTQRQAMAALVVCTGLVGATRVQKAAQSLGRGI